MRSPWIAFVAGVWLVAYAVGNAGAGPQGSASPRDPEEAAIRTLIAAYARSINMADTDLAATLWADTPDVSFIHPMGHQRGWDSIKVGLYEQLMGQTFSERKLSVKDVSIHCYGDSAWAEFYWDFEARLRKDGSALTTHGRETQIYRRRAGAWRLVHAHYSGMPVIGTGQGF